MSDTKTTESMSNQDSPIVKCEEIQDLLLDYSARELGESRSALVREHLLYCDKCKEAFAEIMETVSLLEKASTPDDELPSELTEKHHARVIRALTHPILDWIVVNHRLVAIVMAVIALIGALIALNKLEVFKKLERPEDMGYPVYIQTPPPGAVTNDKPIIIWHTENESLNDESLD